MPQLNSSKFRLDNVIAKAFELGASDVDIAPGLPIIYRVDGLLQADTDKYVVTEDDTKKMEHDYLTTNNQQETFSSRKSYDICLGPSEVFNSSCRVRVQFHTSMGRTVLSCRLIPLKPDSMEKLGIPGEIQNWMRRPGIIIVSGHFGVGKTTTLAAMVDHTNKTVVKKIKILEDPLEYTHINDKSYIFPVEIGKDSPSYANAIMDITRQYVDTVVVGEIRNRDAMEAVFSMAEAGMEVYTTIHAKSATDTIDRVANLFAPADYLQICKRLSRTLSGILFQKLMPKDGGGRVLVPEYMCNNDKVNAYLVEGNLVQTTRKIESGGAGLKSFTASYEDFAKNGTFGERRHDSAEGGGKIS